MVVMTAERTCLPADRPLTIDDLDLLPDDGNRYELDDGLVVMSPSPVAGHQAVVLRLSVLLDAVCPPEFRVFPGLGVAMSQSHYRIPDIVVVRAGDVGFDEHSAGRPPVLAVEVASPSTAIYDRNRKKEVYAGFGIESYWIVTPDPEKPALSAFELRRGKYHVVTEVRADDAFRAARPFPCEIVPSALVAGTWRY
jgi:Uma2 family endonuclease